MKKLVLVVFLLLQGCVGFNRGYPSYLPLVFSKGYFFIPERTSLTFFWEWGEVVLQGYSLFSQKNDDTGEIAQESIKRRKDYFVCDDELGGALLGERIYQSVDSPNLNAECLYQMRSRLQSDFSAVNDFFKTAFDRLCFVKVLDGKVHFYYEGDSLWANISPEVTHRKLKTDESKKLTKLIIDNYPNYRKKTFLHEFVFDAGSSVFSISVQTAPEKLKGYKPLRLDPSILPLESPGYKKLREQEESRMKGD